MQVITEAQAKEPGNAVGVADRLLQLQLAQSVRRKQAFLTTAAIAASASYVSPWVDATEFKRLTGVVKIDQASEVLVEQSHDGATAHTTRSVTGIAANAVTLLDEDLLLPYVRVSIKNTGLAATVAQLGVGYVSAL